MANPFEPASPVRQDPPAPGALADSETHPSPALTLAVQELREFLGTLDGGVVQQRAFINRTVTFILSRLAGKKPVGRVLVCVFRNHRHGGYRFVTGASQPQAERIGFWVQMCRDVHTNTVCHFREATNPIPRRVILTKPRLYAALVLRDELKPIPRGPGPIVEALLADNGNLSSDAVPPPPSQPRHRNASPPSPSSTSPASNTSRSSGTLAPADDDFDNPFAAFAEARRRRIRGLRHGLNFPDSPIGTLLPHRRRTIIDSDPVEQPRSSQSSSNSSGAAINPEVIDLTRISSPGSLTRIRSIRVRFYTSNDNIENPVIFRFEIENSNTLLLSDYTSALRRAGVRARRNVWIFDSGMLAGADSTDIIWSRYRWDEPIRVDRISGTLIVKLGNATTPFD